MNPITTFTETTDLDKVKMIVEDMQDVLNKTTPEQANYHSPYANNLGGLLGSPAEHNHGAMRLARTELALMGNQYYGPSNIEIQEVLEQGKAISQTYFDRLH